MRYMQAEFDYWLENHFVTVEKDGVSYRLARFNCEDNGPRPESYFEDYDVSLAVFANYNYDVKTPKKANEKKRMSESDV